MIRRHVTATTRHLGELVYPPHCVSCRTGLPQRSAEGLCDDCIAELAPFEEPMCQRCGAGQLPEFAGNRCSACDEAKFRFDRATALGPYDHRLRDLLLAAKHPGGAPGAFALGRLLWARRGELLESWQVDLVCPVPMHWRRRMARRANSATLFAETVARGLRRPYLPGLVQRRRSTRPQFSVPASERRANVRRAFALSRGYSLHSARVLLVDDILTTGATCNEVARVLRQHGAAEVAVAVVARSFSQQ